MHSGAVAVTCLAKVQLRQVSLDSVLIGSNNQKLRAHKDLHAQIFEGSGPSSRLSLDHASCVL